MANKLVFRIITTSTGLIVGFLVLKALPISHKKKVNKWVKIHRTQLLPLFKIVIFKECVFPCLLIIFANKSYFIVKLKYFFSTLILIEPFSSLAFISKLTFEFCERGVTKFLEKNLFFFLLTFFASFRLPTFFSFPDVIRFSILRFFRFLPSLIGLLLSMVLDLYVLIASLVLCLVACVMFFFSYVGMRMLVLFMKLFFGKNVEKEKNRKQLEILSDTHLKLNWKTLPFFSSFFVENKFSFTRLILALIGWVYLWSGRSKPGIA